MEQSLIDELDQRYIDYGIVDNKDELKAYFEFVRSVAIDLFSEDFKTISADLKDFLQREYEMNLEEEYILRFLYGFNEGSFHTILIIVSRMLAQGIPCADIAKMTHVKLSKIEEYKEFIISTVLNQ